RSMTPTAPARLSLDDAGGATVTLASAQFGIAPGQAAAFYQGARVIGGGWIVATELGTRPASDERAA
ncbi:MAG: tRNA 2-thiouridine(34) synthase MnmA, partial [Rhodospirillaceae bacterium]|nr:tRNA 2-thiouridine(34) synthase MnmA [Rhodospirillaceae bacterium]